jgi:hypothetical protein
MPNGGARTGAGRKSGGKNKATIARELQAAQQVAAAHGVGREMAIAVLERLMGDLDRLKGIAEGAAGLHKPPTPAEITQAQAAEDAKAIAENREPQTVYAGNWALFGEWYDRAVGTARDAATVAKDLAKYQGPQIKPVDAPAPAPDPRDLDQRSRKRFGLRVFEGGKPLAPSPNTDVA